MGICHDAARVIDTGGEERHDRRRLEGGVMFQCIRRHKPLFMWLNLLFLMFIVLLPFSTDLI